MIIRLHTQTECFPFLLLLADTWLSFRSKLCLGVSVTIFLHCARTNTQKKADYILLSFCTVRAFDGTNLFRLHNVSKCLMVCFYS